MNQLYDLFRRCMPFALREETHARTLLSAPENLVFSHSAPDGTLMGAAVVQQNNILLLCVEQCFRGKGIGSRLLQQAEAAIRAAGYPAVTVGAGADYLVPGVPCRSPAVASDGLPDAAAPCLGDDSLRFFQNRGYQNSWDCCCFDMRMALSDFVPLPPMTDVTFRWAEPDELPAVLSCTEDACPKFTKYYRDPKLYTGEKKQRVFVALQKNEVVGTLLVRVDEAPDTGSVGCTTVRQNRQGRGIATKLVNEGTRMLKEAGLPHAFLGYTYTGLDKMYGATGYRICCHYFMAQKSL